MRNVWETGDGELFESEALAEEHEAYLSTQQIITA